jgi:two-component system sensor histidine kinase DegS
LEVAIYRIVQEALTNIRKHARASRAYVEANFQPEQVVITVRDDGIGFTMPEATTELVNKGNLGLMGLEERVQLFGGHLDISSRIGQGTTVQVMLPRNPHAWQIVDREHNGMAAGSSSYGKSTRFGLH